MGKKAKHKWRIINPSLLAEYAYILGIGGKIYIVTDVEDLFEWMSRHLNSHPLFRKLTDEEQNQDPVVEKLWESTEEGQKVSRNISTGANHGDGVKLCASYPMYVLFDSFFIFFNSNWDSIRDERLYIQCVSHLDM